MRRFEKLLFVVVLLCSALALPAAHAQSDYPNKPIKWIVPYPPGGTTDLLARLMGQYLSTRLGQQVLIENRAGGGNSAQRSPALPDRHRAAMKAKLADLGGVPIGGTPEQFWVIHKMETEKWAKIVQFSGAKAE